MHPPPPRSRSLRQLRSQESKILQYFFFRTSFGPPFRPSPNQPLHYADVRVRRTAAVVARQGSCMLRSPPPLPRFGEENILYSSSQVCRRRYVSNIPKPSVVTAVCWIRLLCSSAFHVSSPDVLTFEGEGIVHPWQQRHFEG